MKQLLTLFYSLTLCLSATSLQSYQADVPDGSGCYGEGMNADLPVLVRGLIRTPFTAVHEAPDGSTSITGQLAQGVPIVLWGRTGASDWLQLLPNSPVQASHWIAAGEVDIVCGSVSSLPVTIANVQQPMIPSQLPAQMTPEQAIMTYYEGINSRQYDYTWSQLGTTFKNRYNCPADYQGLTEYICNVPTANDYDYVSYLSWWNSVQVVELTNIRRLCVEDSWAVVQVNLAYRLFTGELINQPDRYIKLILDPSTQSWLFYDAGYLPRTCAVSLQ